MKFCFTILVMPAKLFSRNILSFLILLIIILTIPLLLIGLFQRQDIRGKAATDEISVFASPKVENITQTQALIKYVTTDKTTTFIAYDIANSSFTGAVEKMGRWRIEDDKEIKTIHVYLLTGLSPDTTYYCVVSGFDPKIQKYISPSTIFSFKTEQKNVNCSATDFNSDGKTDLKDAEILQKCFNVIAEGICKQYDLNSDGKIDASDLTLVTNCF